MCESRVSSFALLMAIFSGMAVQCGYFRTNDVMLASVYVGQIYFLQISELASMKQPKDSLQLAKPTRNSRKIANKLATVASGEINMQSKHNLVCHVLACGQPCSQGLSLPALGGGERETLGTRLACGQALRSRIRKRQEKVGRGGEPVDKVL